MEKEDAIKLAKKAMQNSYSPYSSYKVGAALKTKQGNFYTGCNIENSGIMSLCAERVAFSKAISEGETDFEYILIMCKNDKGILESSTPCGYCRQFMNEFVDTDFKIYVYNGESISFYSMEDLLPHSFNLKK
jgi:cytidine deaminase